MTPGMTGPDFADVAATLKKLDTMPGTFSGELEVGSYLGKTARYRVEWDGEVGAHYAVPVFPGEDE